MISPIHAESLTKKFRFKTVLDSVNLDVPEGSICGLVGPNRSDHLGGPTRAVCHVLSDRHAHTR